MMNRTGHFFKHIFFLLVILGIISSFWAEESLADNQVLAEQIKQLQQQVPSAKSGVKSANKELESIINRDQKTMSVKNSTNQKNTNSNANRQQIQGLNTFNQDNAQAISQGAFAATATGLLPLTPEQIHKLKQMFHAAQAAAAAPAGLPPKPTETSQLVNLSPGSTPPAVRLAEGFVTSIVFLDSTGAPWPIAAYDIGNPKAFNIQWDKKSNMLMVQASTLYTYGNLAVKLKGLTTPVMVTLVPGQRDVDYRVDMRIAGLGPNAKALPSSQGLPQAANQTLLTVLNGGAPQGSHSLEVIGGQAQAWLQGQRIYLRTNYVLLSPAWLATMSSADGTHVYEIPKAPLLLVSAQGKVLKLQVKGY